MEFNSDQTDELTASQSGARPKWIAAILKQLIPKKKKKLLGANTIL